MAMKRALKTIVPALMTGALLASACVNGDKRQAASTPETEEAEQEQAFVTDSLYWVDSLSLEGNKATASIYGRYPTGGRAQLQDSVRLWIAERLSYGGYGDGRAQFDYDASLLADGNALVAKAGRSYMDSARADFERFGQDTMFAGAHNITYEYVYSFTPAFSSDSLLTYNFSGYAYLGGAHGSSVGAGQTFAVSTGLRLDASNMFLPENKARLRDLLSAGLWEQYFGPAVSGDDVTSLSDALLINADTLPMPAFPPLCLKTGVVFTYQQYEIACYAAGMPSCVLPYKEVKPLMRPEVARLLPE